MSSPHGPYELGPIDATMGSKALRGSEFGKNCLNSDCSLQPRNMELELLVITNQHSAMNMYSGLTPVRVIFV
jgi:hypothetical protein